MIFNGRCHLTKITYLSQPSSPIPDTLSNPPQTAVSAEQPAPIPTQGGIQTTAYPPGARPPSPSLEPRYQQVPLTTKKKQIHSRRNLHRPWLKTAVIHRIHELPHQRHIAPVVGVACKLGMFVDAVFFAGRDDDEEVLEVIPGCQGRQSRHSAAAPFSRSTRQERPFTSTSRYKDSPP